MPGYYIEYLTLGVLGVLFLVAMFLGFYDDRHIPRDRGLSILTLAGIIVVIAWVTLLATHQLDWGHYFRYSYLGSIPVLIWLGYCLSDQIYRDKDVIVAAVIAILLLCLAGYLFWPFWAVGYLVSFCDRSPA